MSVIRLIITTLALFAFAVPSAAYTPTERSAIAEELINYFRLNYAPMEYKIARGIDVHAANVRLREHAQSATSDLDLYDAMMRYAATFQDAHVSMWLPSSFVSFLDIDLHFDGERVTVRHIGEDVDNPKQRPLPGDIVTAIDGVPVLEVIRELAAYRDFGHEAATMEYAAVYLSNRSQRQFPYVPRGETTWSFERAVNGAPFEVTWTWQEYGHPLVDTTLPMTSSAKAVMQQLLTPPVQQSRAHHQSVLAELRMHRAQFASRGPRSYDVFFGVPLFAEGEDFVLRSDTPLRSGVFVRGGRRIGYLQIPHWMYDDWDAWLKFMEQELRYFEASTDALLIDHANNSGGMLCPAEQFLSMFIDAPTSEMGMQMRATRGWLTIYENALESYLADNPDEETLAIVRNIVQQLRSALMAGRTLTDAVYPCRYDGVIEPWSDDGTKVFSKPVLITVNRMACSMGDIFPIMMQDIGMPLFGERSMGCGGGVLGTSSMGMSEVELYATVSLIRRVKPTRGPDGEMTDYVENVGAIPDISYEVTSADYADDFVQFREAALDALSAMIGDAEQSHNEVKNENR